MHTSKRRDYAWNTAAGVINCAEAVIMSMVVTRFGKLSDAGVLSIAFAVGNVLMTIGIFGVRYFQASDIKGQYSFRMYMILRFVTLGFMILALAGFLFFEGYDARKSGAVVLIALIYMVEVLESCFWGHYQSLDLLYVGGRMFLTRWVAIITVFSVVMSVTADMIKALSWGAVAGAAVFAVWVVVLSRTPGGKRAGDDKRGTEAGSGWIKEMLVQVFPLFAAEFCSMFMIHVPKFAIDRYLTDEIQACYGFVAMPVFVISMLSQFIYQPKVIGLTEDHHNGEISRFRAGVRRQMLIVTGLTVLCVGGAALIGIPVLSLLYHTDLAGYWRELVIIQVAGGFFALSAYLVVILTVIRKQKIIIAGYATALVLGIAILFTAVRYYGTMGAAVGYLVLMAVLFVFYLIGYKKVIGAKTFENREIS